MTTRRLCLAALLLATPFVAQAGDNPALEGCVDLGAQQQVVRNGGSQAFLLRDGDNHYRIALRRSCGSLATASSLSIVAEDTRDRLCASGTRIKTDRGTCDVGAVELLDAEEFATLERRARR